MEILKQIAGWHFLYLAHSNVGSAQQFSQVRHWLFLSGVALLCDMDVKKQLSGRRCFIVWHGCKETACRLIFFTFGTFLHNFTGRCFIVLHGDTQTACRLTFLHLAHSNVGSARKFSQVRHRVFLAGVALLCDMDVKKQLAGWCSLHSAHSYEGSASQISQVRHGLFLAGVALLCHMDVLTFLTFSTIQHWLHFTRFTGQTSTLSNKLSADVATRLGDNNAVWMQCLECTYERLLNILHNNKQHSIRLAPRLSLYQKAK